MVVELINTGSELMLGRVLNSHQQWLCRKFADLGWPVSRQTAVPDTAPAIVQALHEALSRADLIIIATPHRCYRTLDFGAKPVIDIWNVLGRGIRL